MSMQEPYDYYKPQPDPSPQPVPNPLPVLEPGRGKALAGLILGIIGLIAWLLPIVGYPVAIAGIVLAIMGRRSFSRRTMATVGLVISIIALVLTVIDSFIRIAAFSSHP